MLEMEENDSARDIVKTMIAMCGNQHLDCVTEGIERLGEDFEGRLDQMDLNPVFVKEKGVVVVDAKMIMK